MRYVLRRPRSYDEDEVWVGDVLSIEVIESDDEATGVLGSDGREFFRVKDRPGFVW